MLKKQRKKSPEFPLIGITLIIVGIIAGIIFWSSLQSFLTLQQTMEDSENLGSLVGNIFVFGGLGGSALGIAIIAFLVMIITIPIGFYLSRKK